MDNELATQIFELDRCIEALKTIRDEMVEPNFGGKGRGRGFIPFFCTLFLFILMANLLGLIPLFSHSSITVAQPVTFAPPDPLPEQSVPI